LPSEAFALPSRNRFIAVRPTMIKLCDLSPAAATKLPPAFPDKSGVGVHYVDAFLKPMNAELPDKSRVFCKRKGLRVTLRVGAKKGDGLLRRLEVSRDPVVMLRACLAEAAQAAGVGLEITDREILIAPCAGAAPPILTSASPPSPSALPP
jgi:hypothetical protein